MKPLCLIVHRNKFCVKFDLTLHVRKSAAQKDLFYIVLGLGVVPGPY